MRWGVWRRCDGLIDRWMNEWMNDFVNGRMMESLLSLIGGEEEEWVI